MQKFDISGRFWWPLMQPDIWSCNLKAIFPQMYKIIQFDGLLRGERKGNDKLLQIGRSLQDGSTCVRIRSCFDQFFHTLDVQDHSEKNGAPLKPGSFLSSQLGQGLSSSYPFERGDR